MFKKNRIFLTLAILLFIFMTASVILGIVFHNKGVFPIALDLEARICILFLFAFMIFLILGLVYLYFVCPCAWHASGGFKVMTTVLCAITAFLILIPIFLRIYAGFTPIKTDPDAVAYIWIFRRGEGYSINHPDDFSTKVNSSAEDMAAILDMLNSNTYIFERLHFREKDDFYGITLYTADHKPLKTISFGADNTIRIQHRIYKIVSGSIDFELTDRILENYLPALQAP